MNLLKINPCNANQKNTIHRHGGILVILFFIAIMPMLVSFVPQEARVNQKKIEKERLKKQKQAKADYNKAVKRHNSMQSKSTKASMKKTKKNAQKATPLNR